MAFDWDAIIVGAGPGGSSAAYGLAKNGLRVLLLEKENMPRYKPCGGGLTAKVRSALDFDFSPTIENTVREVSLAFGVERKRMNTSEAWCVMRDKFDALLAERAVKAGAELRDAQPVLQVAFKDGGASVTTRSGVERGRIVIGADGVNGIVRRSAAFPAHGRMGVALEAEMDAPTPALEEWHGALHLDFGAIPWGYAWIFPKAEHLSVGIGDLVRPGHRTDLRAELARYIAAEPSLRGANTRFMRGHRVPLGGKFERYHAPHVLLVGDAAGLVDPFTAEGIYYAIRSGQIAAEEVSKAVQGSDGWSALATGLSSYTRRINAEINSDFRYAWLTTQIFYRIPHLAYRIFVQSGTLQGGLNAVTDGVLTYRKMMWSQLKHLPRAALRAIK
ncbi:MAG TPA: geranylgeranyl reductase family protein [Anaerolineae bacterium]